MTAYETLCPGCFSEKGLRVACPVCGYDESARVSPLVLPPRTLLHGQYLVGKVLGRPGGFGVTYLGWDTVLETPVAIKEYLPRELAGRDTDRRTVVLHSGDDEATFHYGLDQFLREARTLAKFNHPRVVRARQFFQENATAYLVMDYIEGESLAEYLARKGGVLDEGEALAVMLPILDGLADVHAKGFLHRDIKPQNIYLSEGGQPILLDFGAARVAMGERSRSLSVILTPGYAPYEQYHSRGEQGPWTDIYACAATIYTLVTGTIPPDALEREKNDALEPPDRLRPGLSAHFCAALGRALATDPSRRPRDAARFRAMLLGQAPVEEEPELAPTVQSAAASRPEAAEAPPAATESYAPTMLLPRRTRILGLPPWLAVSAGVLLALLVLMAAGAWLKRVQSTRQKTAAQLAGPASTPREAKPAQPPAAGIGGPAAGGVSGVKPTAVATAGERAALSAREQVPPKPKALESAPVPTPAEAVAEAPPVPPPPPVAVPGEPPPPRPVGEAALRARVTSLSALELRQDVRRLARISKAHCLVVLEIVVDPDGRVRSVHPANDECPGLARSLAEQVRRLRFHPFLDEQGVPVAVSGRLNVRFPPPEK